LTGDSTQGINNFYWNIAGFQGELIHHLPSEHDTGSVESGYREFNLVEGVPFNHLKGV
jgi:hypothetical protein